MTIAARIVRYVGLFLWCILGGWTACAVFFTVPAPLWLRAVMGIAIAVLFVAALRERLFVRGETKLQLGRLTLSVAALALFTATVIWYCTRIPDPNQNWEAYHKQQPIVEIEGDIVRVKNVRNFTWRSATDFTPNYEERVYDTKLISSIYYLLVPLRGLDIVAHAFVCFGFSDGQYVSISVEARRPAGVSFQIFNSMFQQYQLIYAIGDERDLVGMRANIRNDPIRFYPARASQEHKQLLFIDMMRRADSLEHEPEFYHLITNNCLNNFVHHVRKLGGPRLPHDFLMLFTGWTDRIAYDHGLLDTSLPFEKAREVYLIDDWIRKTPLDDTFSKRLREMLAQREADARKAMEAAPGGGGR